MNCWKKNYCTASFRFYMYIIIYYPDNPIFISLLKYKNNKIIFFFNTAPFHVSILFITVIWRGKYITYSWYIPFTLHYCTFYLYIFVHCIFKTETTPLTSFCIQTNLRYTLYRPYNIYRYILLLFRSKNHLSFIFHYYIFYQYPQTNVSFDPLTTFIFYY